MMIWTDKHYAKGVPLPPRNNTLITMKILWRIGIVRDALAVFCRAGGKFCREFTFA